ncbi:MAG: gamma-glutamyltransferase [Sphingomonadaceae bacterium]|nr:gamma-glutamyltransferase [Sphingomonadaceae bacterium]
MRVPLLALTAAALAAPAAAQTARAAVDQPTASLFENQSRRAPAATAASGRALVSAADPRAAQAGAEMLRMGGSATDAALAAAIALTVVEPQSSGLGGGAFFVARDAKGAWTTIDGRETAPAAAGPNWFIGSDGKPLGRRAAVESGRSVGVPGLIALSAKAHAQGGRLPWRALFQPAIRLARDGWTLTPRFVRTVGFSTQLVANSPAGRRFLDAEGKPLQVGARVTAPELAATFEAIAKAGPDAFYRGPIAAEIARTVSQDPRGGAPMTIADLAAYRAVQRQPVCGRYRGWQLCGAPPPDSGPVAVLQVLGALERFDLKRLGPDNAASWHLIAEAERMAYADRDAWVGDPGFTPVPTDGLTDPAYLAERSALIREDRAQPRVVAGTPPGAPAAPQATAVLENGTSAIVAADPAGAVVSLTSTVESIFGSGLSAGGFVLNNQLTDFDFQPVRDGRPAANRVDGGKRPRSSMAPIIAIAPDGRVIAVGAAGGSTIIAQVAKTLIALIDWGMSPEAAIAEPVIYATPERTAIERGSKLERMAATLKALGHNVVVSDLPTKTQALLRSGSVVRGGADYRTEGQAVAVR